MKPRYYIGIDTGVNTGYSVWDSGKKQLLAVETLTITQALGRVLGMFHQYEDKVYVYIEDARKRNWFGNAGREQLQGAGSIKRDAKIWEDFCKENKINFEMVAPKNNTTKVSADYFKKLTKWDLRTTEHSRDAAMLVYNR